jgi:formylglycine-generating enzyme
MLYPGRGALAVLIAALAGACGGGRAAGRDAGRDAGADAADAAVNPPDAGADAAVETAPADAGPASCSPDAMPQPNAGLVEGPGLGGCPAGMIPIAATPPFCIDRYEAALVLASDDSPWSPYFNPGTNAVRAASIAGAVPQAYVSGVQAAAACATAGKRLCTDAEWLRACRGPANTIYPYGDTRQPGACNDARAVNPVVEYFGSNDPSVFAMTGHPCIDQLPASLDPTGANAGCVTAEGAFDMMGNLFEWTADPAGTFRGGDYVDTMINGEGCLFVTTAHDTQFWDYSTGFRCCF